MAGSRTALPTRMWIALQKLGLSLRQWFNPWPAREVEVLIATTKAISDVPDMARLLTIVLNQIEQVLPSASSSVHLIEGDQQRLVASRSVPSAGPLIGMRWDRQSIALTHEVAHTRRPMIVQDVQAEPRWKAMANLDYIAAWLCVPLHVQDELLGFLMLDRREPFSFRPGDVKIVAAFADQLALGLRMARLAGQNQHQLAELASLYDLSRAANTSLDPGLLLPMLARRLCLVARVTSCTLYTLDEDNELQQATAVGAPDALFPVPTIVRTTLQSRKTVVASPQDTGDHDLSALLGGASALCIPLLAQAEPVGVALFGVAESQLPLTTDAIHRTELATGHVALAMANLRLLSDARRHTRELALRDQARMMIAAAPPTLEALTLQVTAALVQTAGYAVADCWELRDGRLVLMGLNGNPYSPVELPLTRGVCAQVAKSGIPLLAPNVKDVDFLGADDMPPSEDLRHMILPPLSGPLVSEMCVPIFNDNRVVLVLNVEHTERLRQRDLQLLLDVAAQVTLALEHVRLVSEVQRVQADLARAARMASIGTLAAGVAHEFNNLLAAMVGYAQLGLGGTHEDQVEALQVVEQAGRRGKHITSSLLAFAETGSAQRTITRLGDLADRALLLLEPGLRDQGIALERAYSDEAVVRSDQPQLTQAISNLVSNACDAMPDGGTLTIRTAVAPGWATLSVIDTGHGIDPAVRNHIFEPFVTTKGALGGGSLGGAGLGLAICYGIVQRHGGTIDVQSAVRRGSTFTLRLPLSTTEATPPQGAGSTALRVLVVDRDPVMQALLRATLTRAGYDVIVAADGAGVRVRLRQGGIDALICAASPHDDEDPEIVAQLRAAGNLLPVVFVSSRVEATPVWAQGAEGSTPMVNPFQPDEVIAAVQMATSGRTRWG